MADGGGVIAGVVVDGFLCCKGISVGVGVRVVDLSPSINFLTVSDIFGVPESKIEAVVVREFPLIVELKLGA